jgi:hypothetical protein
MDSTSLLLTAAILLVALFTGAFKFMRMIGTLSGGGRRAAERHPDGHLSFDERLAERLRELEREQR